MPGVGKRSEIADHRVEARRKGDSGLDQTAKGPPELGNISGPFGNGISRTKRSTGQARGCSFKRKARLLGRAKFIGKQNGSSQWDGYPRSS